MLPDICVGPFFAVRKCAFMKKIISFCCAYRCVSVKIIIFLKGANWSHSYTEITKLLCQVFMSPRCPAVDFELLAVRGFLNSHRGTKLSGNKSNSCTTMMSNFSLNLVRQNRPAVEQHKFDRICWHIATSGDAVRECAGPPLP